jgi:L-lactate utilization protein LutB
MALFSKVKGSKESAEIVYSKNDADFEDMYKQVKAFKENTVDSMIEMYDAISERLDGDQAERIRNIFSIFVTENMPPDKANEIIETILYCDNEKQIAKGKNMAILGSVGLTVTALFTAFVVKEKNRPVNFWEKKFWK